MKDIRIVGEVDGVITYEEVKRDTVERADVELAEKRVNDIRAQIEVESKEMTDLIEKIEYAKQILVFADKAKEEQAAKELEVSEKHEEVEEPVSIACDVGEPSVVIE